MRRELLRAVLESYALPVKGIHGLPHWGRVLENGTRLAESTGADIEVVRYFALFHDCRRVNDGWDRGHGLRGIEFAETLRGVHFELTDAQFDLLHYACAYHTDGLIDADPTVQTCWDADRLDLARVWIRPDPRYLCTAPAREAEIIEWASQRAVDDFEPEIVGEWLAAASSEDGS